MASARVSLSLSRLVKLRNSSSNDLRLAPGEVYDDVPLAFLPNTLLPNPNPKLALLSCPVVEAARDPPSPFILGGGGGGGISGVGVYLPSFRETGLRGMAGISVEWRLVERPNPARVDLPSVSRSEEGRAVEARRRVEVASDGGPRVETPKEAC